GSEALHQLVEGAAGGRDAAGELLRIDGRGDRGAGQARGRRGGAFARAPIVIIRSAAAPVALTRRPCTATVAFTARPSTATVAFTRRTSAAAVAFARRPSAAAVAFAAGATAARRTAAAGAAGCGLFALATVDLHVVVGLTS